MYIDSFDVPGIVLDSSLRFYGPSLAAVLGFGFRRLFVSHIWIVPFRHLSDAIVLFRFS